LFFSRNESDTRSVENSRKAFDGYLGGLLDPTTWLAIEEREQKLRNAMSSDSQSQAAVAAYDRIKQAQEATAKVLPVYNYYEQFRGRPTATYRAPRGFYSTLFKYARRLLRAADEMPKPNGERFPEFRDSNKESLELDLFSAEPVYDDVEIVRLKDSLTDLASRFGAGDPQVKQVLAGKSPPERAAEFVKGTKLKDIAMRNNFTPAAHRSSPPPMTR
jgi:hypothetical protein